MDNRFPLVSIVTPLFNSSLYVAETIESVLKQSFENWEFIIVDDCSSDNSVEIVSNYVQQDSRIRLLKLEKNSGTAAARNVGITNSKGKYLVFLDSDDLLDADFLKEQIEFIKTSKATIVTCGYRRIAKKSTTVFIPPSVTTLKTILNGNPISCLTTVIDLSATDKHYFDIELKKCEDFYFWICLLKEGYGPIYSNSKVLASYRILESSKSRNKKSLIKWMLAVYKKTGINILMRYYHLIRWMIYGYKKYRNVK